MGQVTLAWDDAIDPRGALAAMARGGFRELATI